MPYKFNPFTGNFDKVGSNISNPLIFKGDIALDTDFPETPVIGWFYTVSASVTDPYHTHQTFVASDEIAWNGTTWVKLGSTESDPVFSAWLSANPTSGTNTGDQEASDFDIKDLTDSTNLRSTWDSKEDNLGNPDTDDYVLSSKTDGTRSWVAQSGTSNDVIGITTDGAGSTIATGEKGRLVMAYNANISNWFITTKDGQTGSIQYVVKKNGTSLIGTGTKPSLSSQSTNTGNTTDWDTVAVTKGDIITFEISSVSNIEWVNFSMETSKT
jgi:hypothetical protein